LLKLETIREAPKALLHDHLDGGLRPGTVVELAAEVGYAELPTGDPVELGRWFTRGADRKSLELYIEGFRHTVALLQTRDAIERVAAECAEDREPPRDVATFRPDAAVEAWRS
jgi:adenosine deaminase